MKIQAHQKSTNNISISPKKVAITLALAWSAIVFYCTIGEISKFFFAHYLPLFEAFDLDGEMNVPAIYSGLMLLITSIILFLIWHLEKLQSNGKFWLILFLGFFFMANDEVFQIHEAVTDLTQKFIGHDHLGIFTYTWVAPYAIIAIIFGIYFTKFLLSLPKSTAIKFVIAGCIYVGAAVGLEMVNGNYADTRGIENFTYVSMMIVEEAFEIYGICLFIYSLLLYIQNVHSGLTISIKQD